DGRGGRGAGAGIRGGLCTRRGVRQGGAVRGGPDPMGGPTAPAALAGGQRTATIESKTNFFAPIPKGDTARAVCTPLHSGRSTIVLQTDITRGDGRLAAMVIQTQIVLPVKPRPERRTPPPQPRPAGPAQYPSSNT